MKSLEARFNRISEKNPLYSTFISFSLAVRGAKFNQRTISKWFDKLVDKSDYSRRDKMTLLEQLYAYSNS